MKTPKPTPKMSNPNATWDSRIVPDNAEELMQRMRRSGLPLNESEEDPDATKEDKNQRTLICAVVALKEENVEAYVASPSGILHKFAPAEFDKDWWNFAARNYYIVTGNSADRAELARRTGLESSGAITGMVLLKKKSAELSGLSLAALFDMACPDI